MIEIKPTKESAGWSAEGSPFAASGESHGHNRFNWHKMLADGSYGDFEGVWVDTGQNHTPVAT